MRLTNPAKPTVPCLNQWLTECGLQTSIISITWELTKEQILRSDLRLPELEILEPGRKAQWSDRLISLPGDPDVLSSLRTTVFSTFLGRSPPASSSLNTGSGSPLSSAPCLGGDPSLEGHLHFTSRHGLRTYYSFFPPTPKPLSYISLELWLYLYCQIDFIYLLF